MVNRETNFNRKKVRKAKLIRDIKKNRVNKKKHKLQIEEEHEQSKPLTKKQIKKQKRLAQIYKQLDQDEIKKQTFDEKRKKQIPKVDGENNNIMTD
jgi:hypothetical protein